MKSFPPDLSRADEAASEWAVRLAADPLSPAEERAFGVWLEQDPNNQARLDRYQRIYLRLGETVPRLVDAGQLVEEPMAAPVIRPSGVLFRRWATGLAAAAAIAIVAVWWTGRPQLLSTPVAQRQSVALADGSQVELNARTSLAVKLRRGGRLVRLEQGEAFFQVARDPSRPFLVETPAGTVRVTGTSFNVRSAGPGQLEVTVLEGSVAVSPGALGSAQEGGFALTAHDQLVFDGARSGVRQLSPDATADALAWREGWVVFENESLGSAVQRFARYHGREIEISPEAAKLELGGRFKLDELDEFLRDIAQTLPVTVQRPGEGRIRVVPR